MSDNTIKGIGYIRVSTRRQGRAWSLSGQRATIEEYTARAGIDLIAISSDVETGTTFDRSQFSDVLQRLRDGEAPHLSYVRWTAWAGIIRRSCSSSMSCSGLASKFIWPSKDA